MEFFLKPSLEQFALVKTTASLWNQEDIRIMIRLCFPLDDGERRVTWKEVEERVELKVLRLPKPKIIKDKILSIVKPIGFQILYWMKYHEELNFGVYMPDEFCWTSQGVIDRKKTALVLIKDENVDATTRYKLACIYCCENHISNLWHKVPKRKRKCFFNPNNFMEFDLVVFWSHEINEVAYFAENGINGGLKDKSYSSRCAFEYAADTGNRVAVEYFFQNIKPEEREESLFRAATFVKRRFYDYYRMNMSVPKEYYVDVLCFLLSQMGEEQQIQIISDSSTYEVLKAFLEWPCQSFFLKTAIRVKDFLHAMDFDCLLQIITLKIIAGYKDWDYQKLFTEFWCQSSDIDKRYCIRSCISGDILANLFKIGDDKNIKLILKSATMEEKEEIILNYRGKNICERLFYTNNYDALKYFLKECIMSKNVMIKFKEAFKDHIMLRHKKEKREREKDLWSHFFHLLDNLIH